MLISRLAPTPSGYLHIGNIYNFLMTLTHLKNNSGKLWLRIDDGDQSRVRDDYLQDIFECLSWLDIPYDEGPKTVQEFKTKFSQSNLFEEIKNDLQTWNQLKLFSCLCSRKDIQNQSMNGSYTGTCYSREELIFESNFNIRVQTKEFTNNQFSYEGKRKTLSPDLHDLILWKKDQTPSYQMLSLYQDQRIGTNCVIRGEDLIESSAIQIMLSKKLDLNFHKATFYHHQLLKSRDGEKLSKSTNKADQKSLLDKYQSPKQFYEDFSERLGLKVRTTKEFVEKSPTLIKQDLEVSIH